MKQSLFLTPYILQPLVALAFCKHLSVISAVMHLLDLDLFLSFPTPQLGYEGVRAPE